MARLLYTVETGGDKKALDELIDAVGYEFPAFYVKYSVEADYVAALVVSSVGEVPDDAWEKLDGWGHDGLVLELVR